MEDLIIAEEMSLTKPEETWIKEQYRTATAIVAPQGINLPWYDRHAGFVAVVGVIVAVLTLVFIIVPHMEQDMRNDLSNDIETKLNEKGLDHIVEDVGTIKGKLEEMQPFFDELIQSHIHQAASLSRKDFSSAIPHINQIVKAATSGKVTVPIQDIKAIGTTALEASKDEPSSWPRLANLTQSYFLPIVP